MISALNNLHWLIWLTTQPILKPSDYKKNVSLNKEHFPMLTNLRVHVCR